MAGLVPPGTPIAVVAPAHAYDPDRFEAGLRIARERGHDLRPLPGLLQPHRYFAAPAPHRLAQLVEALTDDQYGAVWIVRGGSGVTQLLEWLPYTRLPKRAVIGFSDVVALLVALTSRVGSPVVHGPVVHSLSLTDEASLDHLFDLLEGRPVAPLVGQMWVDGEASGALVGGNLCTLAAMAGTRFQLDAHGAILVLEEVTEAPYRIERNLQQLRSAGVLDGVAGVAVGTFLDCDPPAGAAWSLREVLLDHLGPLGVPVVGGLPIGHGPANRAFPWGVEATLAGGRLTWSTTAT
jgi:muramoyltetrapeptide carboxypeptidase